MNPPILAEKIENVERSAETTLDRLRAGESALVVSVNAERVLRRRLLEMGLLPNTPVRVVRRAPLGDPIQLLVRGYALSIRKREAAGVIVSYESAR